MPIATRIAPKEFVYHVSTRGNNKQDIFKDSEMMSRFLLAGHGSFPDRQPPRSGKKYNP